MKEMLKPVKDRRTRLPACCRGSTAPPVSSSWGVMNHDYDRRTVARVKKNCSRGKEETKRNIIKKEEPSSFFFFFNLPVIVYTMATGRLTINGRLTYSAAFFFQMRFCRFVCVR